MVDREFITSFCSFKVFVYFIQFMKSFTCAGVEVIGVECTSSGIGLRSDLCSFKFVTRTERGTFTSAISSTSGQ